MEKESIPIVWGKPEKLRIKQDLEHEEIEIEGIKYSFDLFKGLGNVKRSLVLNEPFVITKRKNGTITIQRIEVVFSKKIIIAIIKRWFINQYYHLKSGKKWTIVIR